MKKILRRICILLIALLIVAGNAGCVLAADNVNSSVAGTGNKVIYVNASNSNTTHDGLSWGTAFTSLQDALAKSVSGNEIWVAKGIYLPTNTNDRSISFKLKEGIKVYGGFTGTETELSKRDWEKNATILSGNIGDTTSDKDNSYHVVVGANNAIIDGFTIRDGNGYDGVGDGSTPVHISPDEIVSLGIGNPTGAGMVNFQAAPTVANCTFLSNKAGKGGAMYNMVATSGGPQGPSSTSGSTTGTTTGTMSPPLGPSTGTTTGTMLPPPGTSTGTTTGTMPPPPRTSIGTTTGNTTGTSTGTTTGTTTSVNVPVIINCTFKDNFASLRGGAVSNDLGTNAIFIDCKFINNICDNKGGGMYNDFGASPTVVNCLFTGNSAEAAGAMGNDGASSPKISGCTIAYNSANEVGAGLYQGTGSGNNPTVDKTIIWGNICKYDDVNVYNWHECNPIITNSDVQDGYTGTGNINKDPLFKNVKKLDFSLKIGSSAAKLGMGYREMSAKKYDQSRYNTIISSAASSSGNMNMGPPSQTTDETLTLNMKIKATDVVYVKQGKRQTEDGLSWDTAFSSLQTAVDYAYLVNTGAVEIWVANGTYYPDSSKGRESSFTLRKGVKVYGGFKGNETSKGSRNTDKYTTVLSGDIGKKGDNSDNCYHVVGGATDALLDGFTITGGNADGELSSGKGGAVLNYKSGASDPHAAVGYTMQFNKCVFINNYAKEGGAVYNYGNSKPSFTNCGFIDNSAKSGGAVVDRVGVSSTYENCSFTGNIARYKGGAIYFDYGARPNIKNVTFDKNKAGSNGGALYLVTRASQVENTIVAIDNSTFTGNAAGNKGGAIYNYDMSVLTVNNSAFTKNSAKYGGGATQTHSLASTTISNSKFADNTSAKGDKDNGCDNSSKLTVN